MPKSVIKKGILRKIKTADFESLDVLLEANEEIEWQNFEERKEKSRKITEILLDDFEETYNDIVKKLSIDRCIGVVAPKKPGESGKKLDLNF